MPTGFYMNENRKLTKNEKAEIKVFTNVFNFHS